MKTYTFILVFIFLVTNMNSQKSVAENNAAKCLVLNESSYSTSPDDEVNCAVESLSNYYFFPNMLVYFDVEKRIYHYQLDKDWVTSDQLPQYYGGYSLFKNERVMVTIPSSDEPQKYIKQHRKEFPINTKGRIERPALSMVGNNATALN